MTNNLGEVRRAAKNTMTGCGLNGYITCTESTMANYILSTLPDSDFGPDGKHKLHDAVIRLRNWHSVSRLQDYNSHPYARDGDMEEEDTCAVLNFAMTALGLAPRKEGV